MLAAFRLLPGARRSPAGTFPVCIPSLELSGIAATPPEAPRHPANPPWVTRHQKNAYVVANPAAVRQAPGSTVTPEVVD
jgi:hypothetical protein